jgi:lipoyl(octanoyl) transferase
MPQRKASAKRRPFSAHFHLLGCVDYEDCLHVQRRLAYDALTRADGRMVILLCEHPPLITIGRSGSRGQVHFTGAELSEWQLAVRYVSRGGGCLLHCPGQLAIYPILSLDWHRWTVGGYLRRLQQAVGGALAELGVAAREIPGRCGWWGQTGMLAAVGAAVKHGMTSHGAYINVAPENRGFGRVEVVPPAVLTAAQTAENTAICMKPTLSSLLSERPAAGRMSNVRSAVVQHLAKSFGCDDYHMHTGHPLLTDLPGTTSRESAA